MPGTPPPKEIELNYGPGLGIWSRSGYMVQVWVYGPGLGIWSRSGYMVHVPELMYCTYTLETLLINNRTATIAFDSALASGNTATQAPSPHSPSCRVAIFVV